MHWQYLTLALLVVGPLAACHSGGDVAPDGKAPTPPAATTEATPPAPSEPGPVAAEPAAPAPSVTASAPAPAAAAHETSPPPAPTDPAQVQCDARKAAIERALDDAAHCTQDADCTTLLPGCPFGCYRPVNENVSLAKITADIDAYNGACLQCAYKCIPPNGEPRCSAGRCVNAGK